MSTAEQLNENNLYHYAEMEAENLSQYFCSILNQEEVEIIFWSEYTSVDIKRVNTGRTSESCFRFGHRIGKRETANGTEVIYVESLDGDNTKTMILGAYMDNQIELGVENLLKAYFYDYLIDSAAVRLKLEQPAETIKTSSKVIDITGIVQDSRPAVLNFTDGFWKRMMRCLYLMLLSYVIQAVVMSAVFSVIFLSVDDTKQGADNFFVIAPQLCTLLSWTLIGGFMVTLILSNMHIVKPVRAGSCFLFLNVLLPVFRVSLTNISDNYDFLTELRLYFLSIMPLYAFTMILAAGVLWYRKRKDNLQ